MQGNLTVWETTKAVIRDREHREPSYRQTQSEYGTFRKALMKLVEFQYVAQQGSVRHATHKRGELLPQYGLTIKGFMITMVVSERARQNWQAWVKNASKDEALPIEMRKMLSWFIEYGASQRLFLKFFVDPNERLVTSMYNMDTIHGQTFLDACIEKMILTFEEGRSNSLENLSLRDRTVLRKIYQDPNIMKIGKSLLDFVKEEYSEKLQKIGKLQQKIPS